MTVQVGGIRVTQPTRDVRFGDAVVDQFSAFAENGFDKTSGLVPADDMTVVVYQDGVVVVQVVTIAEIGSSGEYRVGFTPPSVGLWVVEVRIGSLALTWKGQYAVAQLEVSAGQVFHDVVRDRQGGGVPYVLVEVLEAGTATLITSATTLFDGSYEIPLSGELAENPLVDLRFSGNQIQTIVKAGVKLG